MYVKPCTYVQYIIPCFVQEAEVLPAPLSAQWCKVTHFCEVVKVFEIDKPRERTLLTDVPHCFCIGDDRCLAWPSVNIAKPAAS